MARYVLGIVPGVVELVLVEGTHITEVSDKAIGANGAERIMQRQNGETLMIRNDFTCMVLV